MSSSKSTKLQKRSPQKEALSPVPYSSPEVFDGDVMEPAKSSKRTVTSGRKRPALADSDSDVEIIETPAVSKKAKKGVRPAPDSPEFKEYPPVTVTSDEYLSTSEMVQPASALVGKEKRIILYSSKPSAKVLYMKETSPSDDETPPPPEEMFLKSTKLQKKVVSKARDISPELSLNEASGANFSPEDEMNSGSEDAGDLESTPRAGALKQPIIKTSSKRRFQSPQHEDSEEEYAIDSEGTPRTGVLKQPIIKTSSMHRVQSPEQEESEGEDSEQGYTSSSSEQIRHEDFEAASPEQEVSEEEISLASAASIKKARDRRAQKFVSLPGDSDDDQQMHWAGDDKVVKDASPKPSTDDRKAVPVIVNEPCTFMSFISLIKEAHFRGEPTDTESSLPLYEVVAELLSGIGRRNFQRALSFCSDGPVVNPAKAHADGAGVGRESRAVAAGGRNSLLFLTTGCVASCQLFIPGTNGSDMYRHNVKKIGIWPLYEEFDAMAAYFGAVFGVSQFYCHFINDILTFQSQKESGASKSSASSASSASGSPKKASALFGARSGAKSTSGTALSFPPFVKFSERVPIYDIRNQEFRFRASDFASLASLPLYKTGISDLPVNAAVTVGYTANTYPYSQSEVPVNSLALSLNIQFVLLHGEITAE